MFAQLFRSLSIFWTALRILIDYLWLDFTNRFRSEQAQRRAEDRAWGRYGRLLRRNALRLRGLIIKVGQFMSARADVLPETFTRELTSLQDAVPTAPYAAIKRRVEEELGAPIPTVFASFEEEALASASLGQVHRAVLKEGQTVAVKVLRPGIEKLVETDIKALKVILGFLERRTSWGRRFDLPAIMAEFETITYQEMDYRQEAENIRTFRKHFADVPGVDVPYPFDNLVTQRLLVMEYKAGMKLTERDRLAAAGIVPAELAQRLVDAYLKQVLIDGFIHVDPHPGNLLVQEDGTLVFIDFGMMGAILPDDKKNFGDLVQTLLTRDLDGAVAAIERLGFLRKAGGAEPLKRALGMMLDMVSGVKLKPGPEMDRFLEDFREWMYEEPLQFPARFIYIGRAIGMLAGLASGLDPSIDWVKVLKERALPMLTGPRPEGEGDDAGQDGFDWRRLVNDWFGPTAATTADVVLKQAAATGLSLARIPSQMERVLGKLETGDVKVNLDLSPVTERLDRQERQTNRLVWAVLTAGAGMAGAQLAGAGLLFEARVAWGAGAVALLFLLGNMVRTRSGRRRRRSPHGRR